MLTPPPSVEAVSIEATGPDGRAVRAWLQEGLAVCVAGPISTNVPLNIVIGHPTQAMDAAMDLLDELREAGYPCQIAERKRGRAKRRKQAAEGKRPRCPCCRESDKVVLPTDAEPARKAFREPYCTRCKGRLSTLPKHRLAQPDFN